jgi:phage baseplate assembly protein W
MPDESAFLGTGWGFPPTFSNGGKAVDMVSGVADIHESLHILLTTRPGERVLQEDFGCALDSVVFEEIDQSMLNALASSISDAILYGEPRIILEAISVIESEEQPGMLLINLTYSIPATNSRFNMVYPFLINEATSTA